MNKKLNAMIIALALSIGLWLGPALQKTHLTQPVHAQGAETNQADVAKWEYCSVSPVNGAYENAGKITGTAVISYMRGNGFQSEKVEATVKGKVNSMSLAKSNALANAVAKLGDEGWEMVGEGTLLTDNLSDPKALYLRRAKR